MSSPAAVPPGSFERDVAAVDAAALVAAKGGSVVTVAIPCRNEQATIGPIVAAIRAELVDGVPLVDELVVIDDGSTDGTAEAAGDAGATILDTVALGVRAGDSGGKGAALWCSLAHTRGDLIVWLDGDVTSFEPSWVVSLLAPLILDPNVELVKACYHRPQHAGGGGRTTELVARPLLALLRPHLADLRQPLSGEAAVRRATVAKLELAEGWGVDIDLVLAIDACCGADSIVEVDLGERQHRHHSLDVLAVQAKQVAGTILDVCGITTTLPIVRRPPAAG